MGVGNHVLWLRNVKRKGVGTEVYGDPKHKEQVKLMKTGVERRVGLRERSLQAFPNEETGYCCSS